MPLHTDLSGRTALVTGAGGAIGSAVAVLLAREGARVALNDLSARSLSAVGEAVQNAGREFIYVVGDVASEQDVRRMFAEIDTTFGTVDILVNNAGISCDEDIFAATLESWNRVLAVHLTGTFLCSREALLRMRRQRWGRIIQISSVTAHQGALRGYVHYASAKAGQLGFTRTLARTAAPFGITVNAVAPGIVDTPMFRSSHGDPVTSTVPAAVPLGISSPRDVAAAVLYLASDAARHVTGAVIDINGGMYMR